MAKYMRELDWQKDEPEKIYDTPIILEGFYNMADGVGAHLPNMCDYLFSDYKNVSLAIQKGREPIHFPNLLLTQNPRDIKWKQKWLNLRELHIHTNNFYNSVYIHVSGFKQMHDTPKEFSEHLMELNRIKKLCSPKKTVLYFMWESTGVEVFEPVLKEYDCIVVTNTWLKKQIEEHIPGANVQKVEHIASYYKQKASGVSDNFIFGFSGGLWERKKADVVVNAFNLMKKKDDILKIHSRAFVNTPPMIKKIKAEINKNPSQIEFKNETLNDKDFAEWWDTLNCYVFVSAGEGYSITPRQALMQGTPVILSKNTSHLDLLDVPGILWVTCEEKSTAEWSASADMHISVGAQFEPILDEVVECMKEVKANYTYWKAEAIKGGKILEGRTSPETIKNQWRNLINE